jgi:hypothetical protein
MYKNKIDLQTCLAKIILQVRMQEKKKVHLAQMKMILKARSICKAIIDKKIFLKMIINFNAN